MYTHIYLEFCEVNSVSSWVEEEFTKVTKVYYDNQTQHIVYVYRVCSTSDSQHVIQG